MNIVGISKTILGISKTIRGIPRKNYDFATSATSLQCLGNIIARKLLCDDGVWLGSWSSSSSWSGPWLWSWSWSSCWPWARSRSCPGPRAGPGAGPSHQQGIFQHKEWLHQLGKARRKNVHAEFHSACSLCAVTWQHHPRSGNQSKQDIDQFEQWRWQKKS